MAAGRRSKPDAAAAAVRRQSFPPVVNADTRLLILGSLPGEASLAAGQYYAHPRNKFWELVGALLDVDLRALVYEERLATLLARGIGLWDVVAEAERVGSLDTAIRNESCNALTELFGRLPSLAMVGFNGGTAARIGRRQLALAAPPPVLVDLPSSSPANTLPFAQKCKAWQVISAVL
jgi:hypoxanthine-DNA glycosylase